ncbi:unnamed protein product [Durusdinium trenchii]|uniref:Uncharacterized protein n=1 Tax=Durusdinium trenchii TaxID=1381693 RepID=A0ABP0SY14_9DINO
MGTSNLAKAGFCFVQPMVRIACHAGVALGNLSRPMKPQMDLDDEEEPMPQLAEEAKTLRASYYCIDAARSHNRLAHQQHLRNLKQFMKEHTEDELLQQVIEKRLAQLLSQESDTEVQSRKVGTLNTALTIQHHCISLRCCICRVHMLFRVLFSLCLGKLLSCAAQ